jgi:hypothetical protein
MLMAWTWGILIVLAAWRVGRTVRAARRPRATFRGRRDQGTPRYPKSSR